MKRIVYVVTLKIPGEIATQSKHHYRVFAESQADTWRKLYPQATVTIGTDDLRKAETP